MMVFILPVKSTVDAQHWPERPCTILYSKLRAYQSDDGTTYKPDILFSYQVQGKSYRSNQVQFMGGSSSGKSGKQNLLRRYPKGSTQVCYVDPSDPTRAVLIKGFTPLYGFALIPLLFMIVGGAGMVHGFTTSLTGAGTHSIRQPRWDFEAQQDAEKIILRASQPRWAAFLILLVFALFWNGAVFGFLVPDVLRDLRRGSSLFLALFSIPFVLIGIGVVMGCVVMLLKLFNPRAELTVQPGTARPGDTLRLRWTLTGGLKPLEELTLKIYGQEKATYRRGTNTYHDKHSFGETLLFQSAQPLDFRQGELTHTLPQTLMPTFDGGNNKVQWFVEIRGVIRQWPDLNMSYELVLSPPEVWP